MSYSLVQWRFRLREGGTTHHSTICHHIENIGEDCTDETQQTKAAPRHIYRVLMRITTEEATNCAESFRKEHWGGKMHTAFLLVHVLSSKQRNGKRCPPQDISTSRKTAGTFSLPLNSLVSDVSQWQRYQVVTMPSSPRLRL